MYKNLFYEIRNLFNVFFIMVMTTFCVVVICDVLQILYFNSIYCKLHDHAVV
jgi:hypothetical protein